MEIRAGKRSVMVALVRRRGISAGGRRLDRRAWWSDRREDWTRAGLAGGAGGRGGVGWSEGSSC